MRALLAAAFHRAAGLARRGHDRRLAADFLSTRGTTRIASHGIFAGIYWLLVVGGFFLGLGSEWFFHEVCCCWQPKHRDVQEPQSCQEASCFTQALRAAYKEVFGIKTSVAFVTSTSASCNEGISYVADRRERVRFLADGSER